MLLFYMPSCTYMDNLIYVLAEDHESIQDLEQKDVNDLFKMKRKIKSIIYNKFANEIKECSVTNNEIGVINEFSGLRELIDSFKLLHWHTDTGRNYREIYQHSGSFSGPNLLYKISTLPCGCSADMQFRAAAKRAIDIVETYRKMKRPSGK